MIVAKNVKGNNYITIVDRFGNSFNGIYYRNDYNNGSLEVWSCVHNAILDSSKVFKIKLRSPLDRIKEVVYILLGELMIKARKTKILVFGF